MKQLLCSLLFICLAGTIFAQKDIRGIVKDASDGEAMIGVTVIVKEDNTVGTSTDIDGNFSLLVPENATLIFSYTGYVSQEIVVGEQTELDVNMNESLNELDEVVVVGYGTQKKSVVTGAISKVKSDVLENMPVTRIENSLLGRTSGVRVTTNSGQPGAGSVVRIRGTTTTGDSNPLYVVDGVPVEGGIDYLSQSDIESIEVLKDASAGIYGARAANGVILITTKKGKAGQTSVSYHGYYGVQNPWRKLRMLNATEYATLLNEASASDGGEILFDDPQSLGVGTDWQDAVFQEDAPMQNHELSISSGTEKSSYFASFSYFKQEGIVSDVNSNYERFTARINSEHKIGDKFTFGNRLAYTHIIGRGVAENSEFGSPLSRAINIDPITPLYETDPDVLATQVFTDFPVVSDENGVFGISELVTSEILNPVAALKVAQGQGNSDKIVGNVYGQFEIIKDLKFRSSIGADLAFWGGDGFTPVYYLNSSNRVDINSYNRSQNRGIKWIFENTLSYQKLLGVHDFALVVGTNAEKNTGQGIGGSIQDIPVSDIGSASLGFFNQPDLQSFYGYEYEDRLASYFGRLNYNYAQKYLLSIILRTDGSSRFGSNNKFGFFPAVSLGWVLTEENFLSNSDAINFFKFRGSWGINGNNRIGNFEYVSTIGEGRSYTFGTGDNLTNGVSPGAIANPDLKWEETTQINVGFDSRLFKKFTLTFDIYNKTTTGILDRIFVPLYVGNTGPRGNIGTMENRGVELELGYKNNIGEFDFDIVGNISYVENEVTFINDDATFVPGQRFGPQGLEITRTEVGRPIGFLFGYQTDGIYQNQGELENAIPDALGTPSVGDIRFVDTNNDGIINDDDRTMIGDGTPTWTYGFNISTRWKAFDMILFGQGVGGNDIYNATRRFDLPKSNYNASALGRWTGEGTSTTYPRLSLADPNRNFTRSSDFFVEDGSFFRIKTLQIGYSLPQHIIERAGMSKLRVYISGNNMFTFTKYKGFDPEIGASFGVDRGIYPQPRFYMMGVNVSF